MDCRPGCSKRLAGSRMLRMPCALLRHARSLRTLAPRPGSSPSAANACAGYARARCYAWRVSPGKSGSCAEAACSQDDIWLRAGFRRVIGQRWRCSRCPPTARRRASRRSLGRRCRASGCAPRPARSCHCVVRNGRFDAWRDMLSCGCASDGSVGDGVVVRSTRTPSFRRRHHRSTTSTLLGQIGCAGSLPPDAARADLQQAQIHSTPADNNLPFNTDIASCCRRRGQVRCRWSGACSATGKPDQPCDICACCQ